ncbi:integrase, catalytic region, zinc finger, CCHC-type containing protein [Tanacetum coccineum]
MILSGADNRPPMLDKDLYDSWKSRMELYMQNREHRRMILESIENGPLIWPTIEENVLPTDIYSLVNHHRVAKDLWQRVQLLMQGSSITKQERECKLYDAFDKFTYIKGETLYNLPPEWSKFMTDVKLVKDLHTTNFDQLHANLKQHELHANEVRLLRERNQDPLAFVANQQMTPPHFNTYQSSYNNPQLQQQFPPSQYGSIHPNQHYSSTYPSQPQFNHSSVPPSYPYQSQMNHQTSSVPQIAYQSPQVTTQPMTESPLVDSSFVVPVFSPGDDLIACLNKAMAFLIVVASSRFSSTNNQLRTSSSLRNQATIQDGRVTMQQVQGRQGQSYSGTGYKSNATSSGGNNASGQAKPKRPRNAAWYKEKAMLAEAQEAGQILDEEQLAFLADPGVPDGQAIQAIIPNNAAFQTEDLDTYDSDCDDISNAKVVLMANISNYGSDIILEIKMLLAVIDDEVNIEFGEKRAIKIYFGKRFTPQQEMDAEQAFWFRISNPTIESSNPPPVKVEVPSELPKVSLVNASLKKLKFHLAQFDSVVKKRTTPDARTEGEWGFEHTKAVFNNEIIPFLKSLKDIFNVFDRDLLNEIMEVQTVFDQMDAVVQQFSVDKQCLEIAKKELFLENDRLLQQIMSQDVLLTVMNSMSLLGESVNMDGKRKESCNLEAELLKSQNAFNDLLKRYSQLERHLYSLYVQNEDLKAQIQDKVFVITSLKNDLRKIKGKEIVDIVAQIPFANTIFPGMFKLDIEPLTPRLLQNRDAHIDYLKYTQEQADILRKIVEQAKAKQPLDKELDLASEKGLLSHPAQGLKCSTSNVHDMCLLDFVENVNSHAKTAKKHKKQNIWKSTGHVFIEVGFKWKPTGRTFTIVGNSCPLTRITSANVVPPKKTPFNFFPLRSKTQKPELKFYSRKPKNVKNLGSSKKAKIVESKNANHSEPNHTWGSNATDIPSSSSLVITGCPDCSLVSGSGCSKHMTGNRSQLMNFVSKFLGSGYQQKDRKPSQNDKTEHGMEKTVQNQGQTFSDSDYAGDNHDRRSTSGGCQYLGRRLVSWQCKKQTIVAISSTEAEYVAAASCCAQEMSLLLFVGSGCGNVFLQGPEMIRLTNERSPLPEKLKVSARKLVRRVSWTGIAAASLEFQPGHLKFLIALREVSYRLALPPLAISMFTMCFTYHTQRLQVSSSSRISYPFDQDP